MSFSLFHLNGPYELIDGASGEWFQLHVQQAAADAEMGCDFRYSEVFLGEVRHNQFHQFFHEFQILGVERFGDIRIGSPQITFRMVVFIGLCSQEDNGDMAGRYVLFDTFREFQAVHHRHH